MIAYLTCSTDTSAIFSGPDICLEICNNGMDDDGDNLIDCDDPDCVSGYEVYFYETGVSTDPTSMILSTAPSWKNKYTLITSSVSFEEPYGNTVAKPSGSDTLDINTTTLNYLESIASALNLGPSGFDPTNFSIDDSFPDFNGEDAEFLTTGEQGTGGLDADDPDDIPDVGTYFSINHQGHNQNYDLKAFTVQTTFQINNVNNYSGYFLDVRFIADGSVELKINNETLTFLSNTGGNPWYLDPDPRRKDLLISQPIGKRYQHRGGGLPGWKLPTLRCIWA